MARTYPLPTMRAARTGRGHSHVGRIGAQPCRRRTRRPPSRSRRRRRRGRRRLPPPTKTGPVDRAAARPCYLLQAHVRADGQHARVSRAPGVIAHGTRCITPGMGRSRSGEARDYRAVGSSSLAASRSAVLSATRTSDPSIVRKCVWMADLVDVGVMVALSSSTTLRSRPRTGSDVRDDEFTVDLRLLASRATARAAVIERRPRHGRRRRVAAGREVRPCCSHVGGEVLLLGIERNLKRCVRLVEEIRELGTVRGDGDCAYRGGAASSANSYANVGTRADVHWSSCSAVHAKFASPTRTLKATVGYG